MQLLPRQIHSVDAPSLPGSSYTNESIFHARIFSSACVYTVELLSSCGRPSSIRRSSVNRDFSETAAWVQAKCYGMLHQLFLQISFLSFFQILNFFYYFISLAFSLTWDPVGAKISKRNFSHSYHLSSTKPYDKYVSHGGI